MLGRRVKIYGSFALLGFLLGVVAYFTYSQALPLLLAIYPQIIESSWLLWGFVGALISVVGCLIYASIPEK